MDDRFDHLEVGYDIPARPGMAEADVQTPALILDLDALERNIRAMGEYCAAHGIAHRVHGKMHKCSAFARLQMDLGGAVGVCCQKASEAEAFVRGGIMDVLISNEVRDPAKIDRLAQLPKRGARIGVCVDDVANVAELSQAAQRHGTEIDALVEIDCGSGRCGVTNAKAAVEIGLAIDAAPGLRFAGMQAYQGSLQHLTTHAARAEKMEIVLARVRETLDAFAAHSLTCDTVTGAGTGSYPFETASGLYTELQCGSYAVMDADYGRVLDETGRRLDAGRFENALFVLTSVMSHVNPQRAIVDAGHKAAAVDSGLPVVSGRDGLTYSGCSDEHGEIEDPSGALQINDKLRLVPGHCDPTCNLHDWFVGVRNGVVETLWPIDGRGKGF